MNTIGLGGRVYSVTQIQTKSGALMTKFRLQVSRYKKDAFYIEVVCFDKQAEFVTTHVQEGSGVFVSGKLDEDSWTKDDVKHYRTKVIADRVEFLPSFQKKEDVVTTDENNKEVVNDANKSEKEKSDF